MVPPSSIYGSMRSFSCNYETNTRRLRLAWSQNDPKVPGVIDIPHVTSAIYITFKPIINPEIYKGLVEVRDDNEQTQLQVGIGDEHLLIDAIKAVEFRNKTEFPRALVPDELRGIKRDMTAFLPECLTRAIDRRSI